MPPDYLEEARPCATVMSENLELKILSSMNGDYLSKSRLSKIVGKDVDAALITLMEKGLVEGISISSAEMDHFKLTKKGEDLLNGGQRRSGSLRSGDKNEFSRQSGSIAPT